MLGNKKTDTKNGTVGILFCEFQEDQCLWVCKVPDNKASETHGSDSALKTQSRGKRNRSYGPSLTIGYLSSKAPDRHLKFPLARFYNFHFQILVLSHQCKIGSPTPESTSYG